MLADVEGVCLRCAVVRAAVVRISSEPYWVCGLFRKRSGGRGHTLLAVK